MSPENVFAQTGHEAPAVLKRRTFIASTLLPVCCVCGLIRDDNSSPPSHDCWLTRRTYNQTYGMNPATLMLTHTYCPTCFQKARETIRQYFLYILTAKRAHELYSERGYGHRSALDDWLEAEREILSQIPPL